MRYRWKNGRRRGRWRATRREALEAAVRAGLAWQDPETGMIYKDALTEVEEGELAD